jgi:hypothetical protein
MRDPWLIRLGTMLNRVWMDQIIEEVAAEFEMTPQDLWDELEQIEEYFAVHGTYPADIQQLHVFHARHGRWPETEAELHEWLRAAGGGV